jgi:hypothetical protein
MSEDNNLKLSKELKKAIEIQLDLHVPKKSIIQKLIIGGLSPEMADSAVNGVIKAEKAKGNKRVRQNWLEEHLNWTAFLAWFLTYPFEVIAATSWEVFPNNIVIPLALTALCLVVVIPLWAWLLRRKGKSLWWLLLVFGILPLAYIWMSNES